MCDPVTESAESSGNADVIGNVRECIKCRASFYDRKVFTECYFCRHHFIGLGGCKRYASVLNRKNIR